MLEDYIKIGKRYSMNMTQKAYWKYFAKQREIKVGTMCKPISAIRGMSADDILELCRQEDTVPVDITAILKKLGISSMAFDFSVLERNFPECANGNQLLFSS